mmetsp:Transcript_22439/g.53093  ORF Transcript_22439/g.53093 Transcript_22439/m.53093 type:complete len:202 (+) Transcript_22439:266-871(+)
MVDTVFGAGEMPIVDDNPSTDRHLVVEIVKDIHRALKHVSIQTQNSDFADGRARQGIDKVTHDKVDIVVQQTMPSKGLSHHLLSSPVFRRVDPKLVIEVGSRHWQTLEGIDNKHVTMRLVEGIEDSAGVRGGTATPDATLHNRSGYAVLHDGRHGFTKHVQSDSSDHCNSDPRVILPNQSRLVFAKRRRVDRVPPCQPRLE